MIPHITNEIKDLMLGMGGPDIDVVIHEIGGTVGDIESLPFLEAARQVRTTSAGRTASSCTCPWCRTSDQR